jgi:hypothetical protein
VLALISALAAAVPALAQETPEERAAAAIDGERYGEAIAICDSELASRPNDLSLVEQRGRAELALGRVARARADLGRVAGRSRRRRRQVADALARVELLFGEDSRVEQLLPLLEADDQTELEPILHGPWNERLGEVAAVASGRTPGGHYLVFSDLGLTDEAVAALKAAKKKAALSSSESVAAIGRILEAGRDAFAQLLPLEDAKVVLRVFVFRSHEDFETFVEAVQGEPGSDDDGDCFSDTRIVAVNADADDGANSAGKDKIGEEVRDTIVHEGFHQLVSLYAPQLPAWLDEGLAEYFGSTEEKKDGGLEVGVVKKTNPDEDTRYETITAALKDGTAPALRDFLALSDEEFHGDDEDRNYGQAWSVAHFLVSKHRELVTGFLALLHEGQAREDAFTATFGKTDLAALDKEWRAYVAGL